MTENQHEEPTKFEIDQSLLLRYMTRGRNDSSSLSARGSQVARRVTGITLRMIQRRDLLIHGLHLVAGLMIVLSLFGAAAFGPASFFWGFFIVSTTVGLVDTVNLYHLINWHNIVFNCWNQDELDLDDYAGSFELTPGTVAGKFRGLFRTLPVQPSGSARIPVSLRGPIASTVQTLNRTLLDRIICSALANSIALISLALAISTWSLRPVASWLLIPPLLILPNLLTDLRLSQLHRRILSLSLPLDDRSRLVDLTQRLPWGPIPAFKKDRWHEVTIGSDILLTRTP